MIFIFYSLLGEGDKVALLLHGWGGSGKVMQPVADLLTGYKVILPDMYGFGKSEEKDTDLDGYVDGVIEILKGEKVDRCTVVGHSFGGRVGIRLAVRYPDLVAELVLIDSAGIKPKRGLKYYCKVYWYKISKRMHLQRKCRGSGDYEVLSDVMRRTFVRVVNTYQNKELGSIRCPTAIIWGRSDKETPMYMARKLQRGISGSTLRVIEGGHFAYIDSPNQFAKTFVEAVRDDR